jgi:5-formyltetrahydrofolate cyclo-ligase
MDTAAPVGRAPADKAAVRRDLLLRRRDVGPSAGARELAEAVAALLGPTPGTVCAYASSAGEPPTGVLLDVLHAAGHRVLLPVLLEDGDLDWAEWSSDVALAPGRLGLMEPVGARLGVDAVAQATMVVCPGLAGDLHGNRLGRGGGSYDRALARTRAAKVLLLHDHEVLDAVPAQQHDQPVDVIVTPARTVVCR